MTPSAKLVRVDLPPHSDFESWLVEDRERLRTLLLAKGHEELGEVATAASRGERLEELADTLEVLVSLGELEGITLSEIETKMIWKGTEKGGLLRKGPGGALHGVAQRKVR